MHKVNRFIVRTIKDQYIAQKRGALYAAERIENMSDNVKMLEYVYKGAEMGSSSISQLIKNVKNDDFRRALEKQRQEYEHIMEDAGVLLSRRGAKPEGVGTMAKVSSQVMTEAKTALDSSVEKMAEMMIQGSTMGVTKISRHLGELKGIDNDVDRLSKRLLETEEDNIAQMKRFLF